jgi:gamma-glutamyltranspeptidase
VAAPRIHQQWRPSELRLEAGGFPPETREALSKLGYSLKDIRFTAVVHALERLDDGRVWGAADSRGEGAAVPE